MDGQIRYAEIRFFFWNEEHGNGQCEDGLISGYALVSVYGQPDAELLEQSYHTLRACPYLGENGLHVIRVSDILSVISMQPLPTRQDEIGRDNLCIRKRGISFFSFFSYC